MLDTIMEIEEGNVSELTKDLAYQGAQDKSALLLRKDGKTELSVYKTLNDIPMGYIEGASFIATLACVHALEATRSDIHIQWPCRLMQAGSPLGEISVSAGFKGGLFAVVSFAFGDLLSDTEIDNILLRVSDELEAWRQGVVDKKILAGPVSQCLNEYFDYVKELGKDTLVQTPEGKLIHVGYFGGLDVWGHAIVVDENEKEKSFAPGEAILICTE